jgi:DNA (cytosine-5)-methyltransferase 1
VALKFVSLFSGCGGFDLGMQRAGFEPIRAFDFWDPATDVYRANLGKHVEKVDLSNEQFSLRGCSAEMVLLGSPCQGFSTIGKRAFDDPRNDLLHRGISIALSIRPKFVICENVPGLLQGGHKIYFDRALSTLTQAGYFVQTLSGMATDAGVPQRRKRVFIIARQGTRGFDIRLSRQPQRQLADVLRGAESFSDHNPALLIKGSTEEKIAKKISPGQKLSDVRGGENAVHSWHIPEAFGKTSKRERTILETVMVVRRQVRERDYGDADPVTIKNLIPHLPSLEEGELSALVRKGFLKKVDTRFDLRHGFNGKFRRPHLDGVANTVDSKFGSPRYFLHPTENRGFSVREAARIQSFPDSFKFSGSTADKFKMIGNAVPPDLARQLGLAISKLAS